MNLHDLNEMYYGMTTILALLVIYFIPAIVAVGRGHRDMAAVIILDLLLGWTVLGWIVCLVWASTGNVKQRGE